MTALLLSLAYLVGALPLGYWLARRRGVDLRTASPYTLGLESALRRLGLGLLLLSFLLDFLKGYLPLLLGRALGLDLAGLLALGVAVYLGHLYPLFFRDPWPLRAKGAGVLLGILSGLPLPPALGLVPVALGLVLYALTGYASLAALGLPLGLLGATLFGGFGLAERLSALALFLLALWRLPREPRRGRFQLGAPVFRHHLAVCDPQNDQRRDALQTPVAHEVLKGGF